MPRFPLTPAAELRILTGRQYDNGTSHGGFMSKKHTRRSELRRIRHRREKRIKMKIHEEKHAAERAKRQ